MISKGEIWGNPFIGLYAVANEDYCFIPQNAPDKLVTPIMEAMDVDIIRASIYNSPLIGLFSVINKRGAVLPSVAYSSEIKLFEEHLDVLILDEYTAIGNLISTNDKNAIISPVIKDISSVESVLGVKARPMTIGGIDVTGSMIVITNSGFFVSSLASKNEMDEVSRFLGLEGSSGTVNYGNPMVKSGIIANTKGVVVGEATTPYEMGQIDEGIGGKDDKNI